MYLWAFIAKKSSIYMFSVGHFFPALGFFFWAYWSLQYQWSPEVLLFTLAFSCLFSALFLTVFTSRKVTKILKIIFQCIYYLVHYLDSPKTCFHNCSLNRTPAPGFRTPALNFFLHFSQFLQFVHMPLICCIYVHTLHMPTPNMLLVSKLRI